MENRIKDLAKKLKTPEWFVKMSLGIELNKVSITSIKEGFCSLLNIDKNADEYISTYLAVINLARNKSDLQWISEAIETTKNDTLFQATAQYIIKKGNEISFAELEKVNKTDTQAIAKIFFNSPRNDEAEIKAFKCLTGALKDDSGFHGFFEAVIDEDNKAHLNIFFEYAVPFCIAWLEKCNSFWSVLILRDELADPYEDQIGKSSELLLCALNNHINSLIIEELSETSDFYELREIFRQTPQGSSSEKLAFDKLLETCDSLEKIKDVMEHVNSGTEYAARLIKKAAELQN